MEERVLGYGVIGTGVYCDHYFGTLGPVFKNLRPVGCADLNTEAAKAAAARWNVPKVYTTEEMPPGGLCGLEHRSGKSCRCTLECSQSLHHRRNAGGSRS